MSDSVDDLDALFEEMANQRVEPVVAAETAETPQAKKKSRRLILSRFSTA